MKFDFPDKRNFLIGFIIGCILAGIFFYLFPLGYTRNSSEQLRLGLEGFVNPLIACNSNDTQPGKYGDLESKLTNQVKEFISKGTAKKISYYFRDLDSAEWIGHNEDEAYLAASLAKVPIMIAYYKIAEYNPEILKKRLLFNSDIDQNKKEFYQPPTSLEKGKYYSVEELINRMIIHSGNNSFQLLLGQVHPDILVKIYLDLDLSISTDELKNFISPKSFSTLWRALYNASYLDKEHSNKALELLTKAEFKSGIVARIPHNVSVAHKFGERTELNPDKSIASRQLHDCGIIYYPDHPYLLCIMTEGLEFSQLEQVLQELSYETYQYVHREYKK
jgi:beta-lactamase class A